MCAGQAAAGSAHSSRLRAPLPRVAAQRLAQAAHQAAPAAAGCAGHGIVCAAAGDRGQWVHRPTHSAAGAGG